MIITASAINACAPISMIESFEINFEFFSIYIKTIPSMQEDMILISILIHASSQIDIQNKAKFDIV
ncbi:MAG: hypothetical protein ACOZBL_03025 [Patescibacteria group bacterium]